MTERTKNSLMVANAAVSLVYSLLSHGLQYKFFTPRSNWSSTFAALLGTVIYNGLSLDRSGNDRFRQSMDETIIFHITKIARGGKNMYITEENYYKLSYYRQINLCSFAVNYVKNGGLVLLGMGVISAIHYLLGNEPPEINARDMAIDSLFIS